MHNMGNFNSISPPLTNVQSVLLQLFNAEIPDKDLEELKTIIARFFLDKARDKADIIWNEKGYTDEKLQQILSEK